ncbi:MAG: YchJ family metal-binding protein [Duodenibacillus massiliensis]
MTKKTTPALCPCGSGKDFAACCGRFLDGGQIPRDAVALMRSRYSAFALNREDWLRLTWAKETCPAEALIDPAVKWIGLTVKNETQIDATHATVEYIARGGRTREGAFCMPSLGLKSARRRWFYVDDKEHRQS